MYQPARASFGSPDTSSILVRGWAAGEQVITTTAPLTMVRFAPDGSALLLAEQVAAGGEQVYLARPYGRIRIVAVLGHVARISWRPDGRAAVLSSVQDGRLTLTLVRLQGSVLAAAIADVDSHPAAAALLPSAWDADGLLWIAPDVAHLIEPLQRDRARHKAERPAAVLERHRLGHVERAVAADIDGDIDLRGRNKRSAL